MKHEITIYRDVKKSMAKVTLNKKIIMEGNYWDFHPECQGITKYGDFKGYHELTTRLYQYLLKEKKAAYNEVKITIKKYTYKY